ncbi:unnamed protein product [Cylicocyclus nassatus]|uniref:Uncharacterized protein n=1 Tax=Cylicocyclus nassatus TaxID=53992 RepID=A0AA36DLV3_CYLNA|nr:unnamed protein product [Cylicocyclus nassatus]
MLSVSQRAVYKQHLLRTAKHPQLLSVAFAHIPLSSLVFIILRCTVQLRVYLLTKAKIAPFRVIKTTLLFDLNQLRQNEVVIVRIWAGHVHWCDGVVWNEFHTRNKEFHSWLSSPPYSKPQMDSDGTSVIGWRPSALAQLHSLRLILTMIILLKAWG